jgi:hypothetical protein
VIVGTSLGLLYVLDGESDFVRRFFPMQFHSIQAQVSVADLAGDRDLEMVVLDMGGTVAVVSVSGEVLWDAHLSGTLPFPATIGDVDGDGQLDVVVVAATEPGAGDRRWPGAGRQSAGSHIYVLRGDTGEPLPGYPIALPGHASISAPVLLAKLQAGIAVEKHFGRRGVGPFAASASASGANASSSFFSAQAVKTRKMRALLEIPDDIMFPFAGEDAEAQEEGEVGSKESVGLHLIVTSFEGSIFVIYGKELQIVPSSVDLFPLDRTKKKGKRNTKSSRTKFLAQRIDVGEHIYSSPLLDDITGDGYSDLLVGTLNGQVLLFESDEPHDAKNTWASFPNHRANGFSHGHLGVLVTAEEKDRLRQFDTKGGRNISISFEILDSSYDKAKKSGDIALREQAFTYSVSITKGTNRLQPIWKGIFDKPGKYTVFVPVSPPERTLLVISLVSEHGQYTEDTMLIAVSTRFYVWIKYLLIGPLTILCATLLARYKRHVL